MIQKTMFDNANLHRKTDPETSVEAAQDLIASGKLGRAKRILLEQIAANQPATSQEAASKCAELHGGVAETYRKRDKFLRDYLLIQCVQVRVCNVTNTKAREWVLTEKGRQVLRGN